MKNSLENSPFLRACRRETTPYTPVWLMRQAGRYMKEYRELRARVPFLELCHNSDLAAEAAIVAAKKIRADAAILFSDILLILQPMGMQLEFLEGEGPSFRNRILGGGDVAKLHEAEPERNLNYVFEAVRKTRAGLPEEIPLIGFCGAPFTLASYMIEGGSSRNFDRTKSFFYRDAGAWHDLMQRLVRGLIPYLNGQIAAGAQAVQIFDSWVGCLSPDDYREYVLPHSRALIAGIAPGIPVIHFGAGTATLLESMKEAGSSVLGVDFRVPLADAWKRLGSQSAIQGNLDPAVLFADKATIRRKTEEILRQAADRPGHIFNLGHGVLPGTPEENVIYLTEIVHELSAR